MKGWKPSDNAADKLFGKQGFLQEPEMDAGRYNAKEHRREVRQMSMLDVSPASLRLAKAETMGAVITGKPPPFLGSTPTPRRVQSTMN